MRRPVPRSLCLVAALAAATAGAVACTHDDAPAKPALTGSLPVGASGSTLPTLGPDTIPTTTPGTAR